MEEKTDLQTAIETIIIDFYRIREKVEQEQLQSGSKIKKHLTDENEMGLFQQWKWYLAPTLEEDLLGPDQLREDELSEDEIQFFKSKLDKAQTYITALEERIRVNDTIDIDYYVSNILEPLELVHERANELDKDFTHI